jgi:HSP20 family protein
MRRSTPFDEIERAFERMARQFDEMNSRFDGWSAESAAGIRVDVADYDDEIVVTADLPGFEKEDIDISVADRRLSIEATHEVETDESGDAYVRRERRHESMRRSIQLPEAVDEAGASASYVNGVLTVSLPKIEVDEDSHHIDVR